MPRQPQVLVKDRETGHEYEVSVARYKRTPHLWDRLEPVPAKPRTTVAAAAAKKTAARAAKKTTASKRAAKRTPSPKADDNKETS